MSARRLVGAVLLVAGCSILAPRPDPFRFVVLTPLADTDAASPRRDGLVVGVGPIALPGYLRRPEMATRVAPNRIAFSDTVRWAEPLDTNFTHVLSRDLSLLLGTDAIVAYPWSRTTRVDYGVGVQVLRFERDGAGSCELAADVAIRRGDGTLLRRDDVAFREAGDVRDGDTTAAALSRTVGELGRTIAAAIAASADGRPDVPRKEEPAR